MTNFELTNALRKYKRSLAKVDIMEANKLITISYEILAKEEGIYSEKTCAFSFATLEKLVKSGIIKKNEKIIIPITGSGLKEST